ncbi:synaptic vesicular amine transporter-like isoform X2 [Daphnia carinata]|uniref:synaptic vesicular amine transporter-like isoform X2 n=1 Tax=Daphnia carinata TaxID=120202 RepID=UPI00257B920C|nr:synaptic vesicular amine transporter-like isoform X2 [Daphnia carinata]
MRKLFARERTVTEKCVLLSVYFALLLDNLLLTAVVPILPHFVHHDPVDETGVLPATEIQSSNETLTKASLYNLLKSSAQHFHIGRGYQPEVGDNSRLGFLLSLKAIVQLVANPLVAIVIQKKGFSLPLVFGTINLILCSLLFAFGRSYEVLSSARALQGITSACFTIAGLGLVASTYREEAKRSEAIGRALGGGAVGVLLGYPIAGFLYHLTGKTVPFLLITFLAVMLLVAFSLALRFAEEELIEENICFSSDHFSQKPAAPGVSQYVNHRNLILGVAIGAIFLTTSVMSLLEPCLPLWLMKTMKPERWQLGAVFIPDSCGYLLTTHFLGGFAYRVGRWKVAMLSVIILGISCTLVPLVSSIIYLTGPHFGIGIGIGAVDASLVPLLATLADKHPSTDITDDLPTTPSYGRTFALGQTAVSLAYCLGPILGGVLVESLGFPRLMLCIGILNLLFSPLILILKPEKPSKVSELTALRMFSDSYKGYSRFEDEEIDYVEEKR